jgi:hypothetical protein
MTILLLGALGAITVATPLSAQAGPLTPQERAEGEGRVQLAARHFSRVLRDPASAAFRNVFLQRRSGRIEICGEVNARNGFGGLAGYQPFAVVRDEVYLPGSGADFTYVCGNPGSVIDSRDYSAELLSAIRQ